MDRHFWVEHYGISPHFYVGIEADVYSLLCLEMEVAKTNLYFTYPQINGKQNKGDTNKQPTGKADTDLFIINT